MGIVEWGAIILACCLSAWLIFMTIYTFPKTKRKGDYLVWSAMPIMMAAVMLATYILFEELYRPY